MKMSEGSVKRLINKISNSFGIQISRKKFDKHTDGFVTLRPEGAAKGNVLLAYIIDPFLLAPGEKIPNSHTHFWESILIADTFLDMGYMVDVISYLNSRFKPVKRYSFFVSARTNFQRIARILNKDCIKIAHLDMAHWITNNYAAHQRCFNAHKRKKAVIKNYKIQEENFAIEYADYATVLGNEFTLETYQYAKKMLFPVPVPISVTFPPPEDKDFNAIKKNYLWFGSGGLVHKGLDLVLEAFAQMPEYSLTVCGPIEREKDFEQAYFKELYKTQNINTIGWMDIESTKFESILKQSVGIVYPSCAEGQSGGVLTCMQGGLIPIISYETGIDVRDEYGLILKNSTVGEIKNSVWYISGLSDATIKQMAKRSKEYVAMNHTKDAFKKRHREVIKTIIELEEKKRNTKKIA
jgi:glycosyltransferase involved in cell wall biosynthesis